MRTFMVVVLSFAMSLLFCPPSLALECYTDLDCTMGNRCVKQEYEEKGTCREGSRQLNPGQNYRPDPERPQGDTKGKMCWSNKDCESGLECIMKSGQMYGICR